MNEINDLLEFIHGVTNGGDMLDTAKAYLAEKQMELAEMRKALNISKCDTIDELLECGADMFEKAISTGDKRRIAECLESEFKPDYFTEEFAAGIKLKAGRHKGEWDFMKVIEMNIFYNDALAFAQTKENRIDGEMNSKGKIKKLSANDSALIRTADSFGVSASYVRRILGFHETPRIKK